MTKTVKTYTLTNNQTGEVTITMNAADFALWLAARELLAVAQLALDYLDGQEYAQACDIIARAQNELQPDE
jgi:hypothetical protein